MKFESSMPAVGQQSSEMWTAESHPLVDMAIRFNNNDKPATNQTKPPETNNNNTNNQKQETNVTVKPVTNVENTNTNVAKGGEGGRGGAGGAGGAGGDSSSTSTSVSRGGDSHSSASGGDAQANVGPIDNKSSASSNAQGGDAKGGEANSISQGGAINERNVSIFAAPVTPAIIPPGGACTTGKTWGATVVGSGFTRGGSKIDEKCQAQQNIQFDKTIQFQAETRDKNLAVQLEVAEKAAAVERLQIAAQASARSQENEAQMQSLLQGRVNAVCEAAVKQAEAAGKSYDNVDKFSKSKGPASASLVENNGELARQQAVASLKLGYTCAEASAAQLGVDTSKVPDLPAIKVDEKRRR